MRKMKITPNLPPTETGTVWKLISHYVKIGIVPILGCLKMFQFPFSMQDYHRIIEWPGLKRIITIIEFQPPCYVQGHQPLD